MHAPAYLVMRLNLTVLQFHASSFNLPKQYNTTNSKPSAVVHSHPQPLSFFWVPLFAVASAYSQKTAPLEPGGALILGGEQDCFGGCVDPQQGFYGSMDEVRIWKVVRTQEQIMRSMRCESRLRAPARGSW